MIRLEEAGTTIEIGDVITLQTLEEIAEKQNKEDYDAEHVLSWFMRGSVFIPVNKTTGYSVKLKATPDYHAKITGFEEVDIPQKDEGDDDVPDILKFLRMLKS